MYMIMTNVVKECKRKIVFAKKTSNLYISSHKKETNMKLKIYLVKNKISIKDFSKQLRYSRDHISRVINGLSRPSRKLSEDIEKFTKGEITVAYLLGGQDESD